MRSMAEVFVDAWRRDMATKGGGLREVSPTHPLRLFYGADEFARARFVMISKDKPGLPQLSDLVKVERGQREIDSKWTLSLTLLDDRVLEVFLRLSEDLVRRSATANSEAQAIASILSTLDDWRRLLKTRGRDVLTLDELRGLVGEVWVATNHFDVSHCVLEVIDAWVGPHGHPQDFAFATLGAFEVKSVGPTAKRVKITSAEQLDSPGLPLELIVLTIPNASESTPGAVTLVQLATVLRARYIGAGGDPAGFDIKFEALGVKLRLAFYSETWFSIDAIQTYEVSNDFPAIRASALPPEISGVQYQIARSAITPFERSSRTIG